MGNLFHLNCGMGIPPMDEGVVPTLFYLLKSRNSLLKGNGETNKINFNMDVKLSERIAKEVVDLIKKEFHTNYLVEQENYGNVVVFDLTDTYEYRRDLSLVISLDKNTIEFNISKAIMIKNNITSQFAVDKFASLLFRKFSTGFKYSEFGDPSNPIHSTCEFLVNLKSDDELKTIIR